MPCCLSGTGVSVNVTIANGVMPLLRDTKPFFSYTGVCSVTLRSFLWRSVFHFPSVLTCSAWVSVGPAPPPVLNVSNIGAQHLDINGRVAYDLWDAVITTGYWYARSTWLCLVFYG